MRLICGASGSGKTALVFREFADAVRQGLPRPRIVVPTATLVHHYRHELARSGLVFDPGAVMSLSRFALDCAPSAALAPHGLLRALVRDSLSRLSLPEFAEVAGTAGMADLVIETITLFENADCVPEKLARARGLTPRGRAFARLWRDVDAAVSARGFVTRGRLFREAARHIPPGAVWMDGFLKLSQLERGLVRAVAGGAALTLALAEGSATDDLRRFAAELGASPLRVPAPGRSPATVAVKAPVPEREADEIARRILELRAAGTAFSRIAVALRDVESWLPLLRGTFDRFGIPARYYFSTPLRAHPVAVFLGGLMNCAARGWDFEPALAALRAHPAWGHGADFDRFDFSLREAMPKRGADALLACCDSPRLRPRLEECLSIAKWAGESARPAAWQRRFQQFADRVYRPRAFSSPADYAALECARGHAAALRAFSGALENAACSFPEPDVPVSFEAFCAAAAGAIDDAAMQVEDHRQNVVHVMSAFEARQWDVRALFVCGMLARDYPRRRTRNLLFSDADVERLRRQDIPLLSAAEADRDEDLLFESLKTRASETLVLTFSARDSGGQSAVPSVHLSGHPLVASSLVAVAASRPGDGPPPAPPGAPGLIAPDALASLAGLHRTVSVTALEQLAQCRFRFFAGRTLELEGVPDRPARRLQPIVRGSIMHRAMEEWLGDDRRSDFVAIFERVFDACCEEYNIPPGYALEVERIESRRIARRVSQSAVWPVLFTETEVDCSFDFACGVNVRCRVDRIDHIGDGNCVIVDYKSSKVRNVERLVESETSLQGPLYAWAVQEKKHLNPVAMFFLAIREDKAFGWGVVPGSSLQLAPMPPGWSENARRRADARLAGFLSGDVHAEPASRNDCTWCEFSGVCRIEQQPARTEVAAS